MRRMKARKNLLTFILLLPVLLAAVAHVPARAQEGDPVRDTLEKRNAELDSLLNPESLERDTSGLNDRLDVYDLNADSLFNDYPDFGDESGLDFSYNPLSFTTYNRVEGFRLGIGFGLEDERSFDADAGVGYAFEAHRWSGFGRVTLGAPTGPAIRLEAHDRTIPFGPNRIEYAAGFLSLVAGQDRQDYLRTRGGAITVWPFRKPSWNAWTAITHREDFTTPQETDYSLFGGGTPMEQPNPMIDNGRTRHASLGGEGNFQGDAIRAEAEAGVAGGDLGGDFTYSWQSARLTFAPTFPDGGVLTIFAEGMHTAGEPPVQALPYLGGDGNLRAYERLEFVGKSRLSGRIEYATGVDILARTGVDFLAKLKLQFIPFTDLGTTWGDVAGVEKSTGNLEGEIRNSFGIGLRREFWLPGIQAVRVDVSRRTDGADDPWSVWVRILPLE